MSDFIKLKTTDHQIVYLNKSNISGIEPVEGSAHSESHIRVYAGGFKWLVSDEKLRVFEELGIKEESS